MLVSGIQQSDLVVSTHVFASVCAKLLQSCLTLCDPIDGSPAYLRLMIFLPEILIPACVSSSPAFLMMYSAYKLGKFIPSYFVFVAVVNWIDSLFLIFYC